VSLACVISKTESNKTLQFGEANPTLPLVHRVEVDRQLLLSQETLQFGEANHACPAGHRSLARPATDGSPHPAVGACCFPPFLLQFQCEEAAEVCTRTGVPARHDARRRPSSPRAPVRASAPPPAWRWRKAAGGGPPGKSARERPSPPDCSSLHTGFLP
jgi:hypothetical protein